MSERLATYLHHHQAGGQLGIELLETLRDQYVDDAVQPLVEELLQEVQEDLAQLQQIIDTVGAKAGKLQATAAWLARKASPTSATLGADQQLAKLELLEMLSLGVLGKRSLWRSLLALPDHDWVPVDLEWLHARAESQYARIETQRIAAARQAFASDGSDES